jgi:3-dehydroquinate dehydratase
VAPSCVGTIAGFGARSYVLALDAVLDLLGEKS